MTLMMNLGKQQKKLFFSGPSTKRGGEGKGLATKKKYLLWKLFFYFVTNLKYSIFTLTILRSCKIMLSGDRFVAIFRFRLF